VPAESSPIINSVAVALGSEPEHTAKRVGHYLMMNVYMVTKTTSYMFFTAMAGNILALKMIEDICHIKLSWGMGVGRHIARLNHAVTNTAYNL
jgi:DASS family divalent anion:Na+ symporter